jgi:hypothetical protein
LLAVQMTWSRTTAAGISGQSLSGNSHQSNWRYPPSTFLFHKKMSRHRDEESLPGVSQKVGGA